MKSLIEISGFEANSVQQVWSDQILSQDMVEKFFPKAIWRLDQWHFFSTDLRKQAGCNAAVIAETRLLLQALTQSEFLVK
tara:strand:+ start:219 stop:458 length:240 start_codon:yes stop_codon:yes gene_type:complete